MKNLYIEPNAAENDVLACAAFVAANRWRWQQATAGLNEIKAIVPSG